MRFLGFIFLMAVSPILAQQGGSSTYSFLELESSARIAGTGGALIAVKDGDAKTAFVNPSLLDTTMHGALAISYVDYFAKINYATAGYVHRFGDVMGSVNLMYLNYGKFQRTDKYGNQQGEFVANDMVLSVGAGKTIDSLFSIGANLKFINSVLESYSSFGVAVDLAGSYHRADKEFTASMLIRNAGTQLKSYYKGNKEPLPFRVDIGFSKKASKAPFRLNVLFRDLQKWDLTYQDPNARAQTDLNGEIIPIKEPGFGDKLMRHVGLALEFVPSESFYVDFGFNYRRRQELKLESRPGMVGFSIGAGIKIKRFMFSYGRASYHRAGASNHISITTDIRSR